MSTWTKILYLMVCCSVAFNIYQYQQVEELSTTPENKQGDALKDTKRTYELSSTENSEEPKQNEKKSSGNTFLISDNNLAIIDETDEKISNVSDVISGEVDAATALASVAVAPSGYWSSDWSFVLSKWTGRWIAVKKYTSSSEKNNSSKIKGIKILSTFNSYNFKIFCIIVMAIKHNFCS